MRSHLALIATVIWVAGCTRTLESTQRQPCPPPRPQRVANGVGIIGMSLDQRSSQAGDAELFVDRVVPDGPAAAAGIHPGDRILAIEGTPTRGMSIAEAARRLRGPTEASITLEVATAGRARSIILTRVAPSELWNGAAKPHRPPHGAAPVRASDVAPAAPVTAPPCRR